MTQFDYGYVLTGAQIAGFAMGRPDGRFDESFAFQDSRERGRLTRQSRARRSGLSVVV